MSSTTERDEMVVGIAGGSILVRFVDRKAGDWFAFLEEDEDVIMAEIEVERLSAGTADTATAAVTVVVVA